MATISQQQQPAGPTPQPLHQQPQQQQQQQQKPPSDVNTPLTWDGDRMFHIYIYDYCSKRGFVKTAKELQNEAELSPDAQPPINAKQGLLFEWWSVFWVLFTTKSNGSGTEDAMLYTQHQSQQTQLRQQRLQQPPGPHLTFDAVGRPLPANGAQQPGVMPGQVAPGQPGPPGQQPLRMVNGVVPRPSGPPVTGGPTFLPNGAMANGPLPNGVPAQGPPFTPGPPGAAPRLNGAVVGGPPFQPSPTMANTPGGGHIGPGPPGPQPGVPHSQQPGMGQPPMNQMGPGPQGMGGTMSRPGTSGGIGTPGNPGSMLPPNSGPGSGPPGPGQQAGMGGMPGQPPAGFGRPPSRTNTPGAGMIIQQSPSMMNRNIPGAPGSMMGMGGMSPSHVGGMAGMPMAGTPMNMNMMMLQNELSSIPPVTMKQYKTELGFPDRDHNAFSDADKMKLLNHHRTKTSRQPPLPMNAIAGPSNMRPNMPMPPGQQRPPGPPNQQTPPQAGQRAGKRSPGEDPGMLPGQSDSQSSPRSNKRPRHSPQPDQSMYPQPGPPGQPPQGMPGQPGPGGTPVMNAQGPPMNVMRQNPPGMGMMTQGPPMMMVGPGPNPGMNGPPMAGMNGFGHGMNGSMQGMMVSPAMSHPQPGGMNNQQMAQYRHNMQAIHKLPGAAGSPAAADSPFNPGIPTAPGNGTPRFAPAGPPGQAPGQQQQPPPQNSQAANKPIMHSMPPPPSPSMKDQNAGVKDANKPVGGSPQNQVMRGQTPTATGGTAPPTPGPGPPQSSTPNPSNPMTAPSPSAMMGGGNPPMSAGPPPSAGLVPGPGSMGADLFQTDFINSVANGLDDFDAASMFRPDGDINFERDFGQWFNGDDAMGGLA